MYVFIAMPMHIMFELNSGTCLRYSSMVQCIHAASKLQVAGQLEEMLSLAKASEQFSQYMMGSMQDAAAPHPLDPSVEKRFCSGQFSATIRELIAYYIAMVCLPCILLLPTSLTGCVQHRFGKNEPHACIESCVA